MICFYIYKFARKLILQLALSLFLSGCISYKIPTPSFKDEYQTNRYAFTHPLYKIIPRHRSQIEWYDAPHWLTWVFFGNDDDGIFGEEDTALYCPQEEANLWKAVRWSCRNPLHNFCYYVIGSAHRVNSEFALIKCNSHKLYLCTYRPEPEFNFEKGPSFFLGFHGWKPFFHLHLFYNQSYRGQFYLGWRERGNFGIKLLPIIKRKPTE